MGIYNPVDANVFDLVTTIIPDPGAGNMISWPVPDNARIQIIYLGFLFSTAVNVVNRYMQILGTTPTLSQLMGASDEAVPAAQTYGWAWVAGLGTEVDLSIVDTMVSPLSPMFILEPGDLLETFVQNGQAGDMIYSIICRYKQWIIA